MVGFLVSVQPVSGARARGCYTCAHNQGRTSGEQVVCDRDSAFPRVIGIAKDGCAFWQREPGSDDE